MISPVWIRKAGLSATAVTWPRASWKVPVTLVFTGLLKPRWLSLTWAKVKPVVRGLGLSDDVRPRNAAGDGPDHGTAGPGHAFQEPAAVRVVIVDAHVGCSRLPDRFTGMSAGIIPAGKNDFWPGINAHGGRYGLASHRMDAMATDGRTRRFELLAMPHLDAAFNLARWLTGNTTDAEDVVQDAYLRAFRYLDAFRGDNFRVWLLTIVRNSFLDWLKDNRSDRQLFQPATDDMDVGGYGTQRRGDAAGPRRQ